MQEDRRYAAEADEDGGGRDEKYAWEVIRCKMEEVRGKKITKAILDDLTVKAKASSRLRMNLDLRDSEDDQSQRMLNAIEPGSVVPIQRHQKSSETVVFTRIRPKRGLSVGWAIMTVVVGKSIRVRCLRH